MTTDSRFICCWPECDKSYSKKSKLTEHFRSHTGERPFRCTQCDSAFVRHAHLQRHQSSVHAKQRPFVCEHCDRSFSLKQHLKRHFQRQHTNPDSASTLKIIKCSKCEISFSSKSDLKRHFKSEHQIKSYACHCGAIFPVWSQLVQHRRIEGHPVNVQFDCLQCQQPFSSRRKLNAHFRSVHAQISNTIKSINSLQCSVCQKTYSSAYNLSVHMRSAHSDNPRVFQCSNCPKSFRHKHTMLLHHRKKHLGESIPSFKTKPEPPIVSPKPIEQNALEKLLGIAGDRTIQCSNCQRLFSRQCDLSKHVCS